MPKDYLDDNLSKMYLLESERKKLEDMAQERLKNGESLSSPELLQQEAILHRIMNEEMLDALAHKTEEEKTEE
ncbi:hypothetical protein LJC20_03680 [Eubacteriales bacterium OttesenSCG-928-M02]|nr:hypothetical protein [Eubacteriales bacterium OttesenSCG-928-M02]